MGKMVPWITVLLAGGALCAQDLSGNWQGTLQAGPQGLRIIVQFAIEVDAWTGTMYSIDQTTDPFPVSALTRNGSNIKFKVDAVQGSYEGKLSPDGTLITGSWTQGVPLPLELHKATKETAWQIDPASHTVQFVAVDADVKLEVLDWGGSGRPVVLLTGLGNNAHVYDKFAPKLTGSYHVYGITRRGFGASSKPDSGYSADRLGDDVLAVIDSLKISKPVLVGHSIAGEELSSVGSRHPEKVAGLIYLDAGYSYAYYDPPSAKLLDELQASTGQPPPGPAGSIMEGRQKYTKIPAPILAIFAAPHALGPGALPPGIDRASFEERDKAMTDAITTAFEKGLPTARVVRLPHADHYVFRSNEADVLREMNAFLAGLTK